MTLPQKLWLEALRGRLLKEDGTPYTQAQEYLRVGDTYCCLGVACDLHRRFSNEPLEWDYSTAEGARTYGGVPKLPPAKVGEWLACSSNPEITIEGKSELAAKFNDVGKSFAQIADALEAKFNAET